MFSWEVAVQGHGHQVAGLEPESARARRRARNILMNYVRLTPGVPARMHWTDDYWIERDILERETGRMKRIRSLVFWVDELDGQPSARTFSVLSTKLQQQLTPLLPGKRYLRYDIVILQQGAEFYTDWQIQLILRPGESPETPTPPV